MGRIPNYCVAMMSILLIVMVQAQKPTKGGKAPPAKTPNIPNPFLSDTSGQELHSHELGPGGFYIADLLVQQNSSLPFSMRFPRPERKSSRFVYPMLPHLYWALHKRPEVPLVEPDQELGLGYDYNE